jgi:hypothetical protein
MYAPRLVLLVVFASGVGMGATHAEGSKSKPARPSASAESGEVICTPQGCRPVRKGCHLERVGFYNEEICK